MNQFGDVSRKINPGDWAKITPVNKFIFSLIYAARREYSWIMIEAKGLAMLGLETARFYLDLFRDKFIVIVYNDHSDFIGSFGETCVAVEGEGKLIGIGTPAWFMSAKRQVVEMIDKFKKTGLVDAGRTEDDEEDEE